MLVISVTELATPRLLARELKIPIAQRWKRLHHAKVRATLSYNELFEWAKKIETELVVQQRWLTEHDARRNFRNARNSEFARNGRCRIPEKVSDKPHTLIQFASPEVGKKLLHLRYLTVTSRLSFFADLGLPALREGADVDALRDSVGHAQARVRARQRRACLRAGGQDERALVI